MKSHAPFNLPEFMLSHFNRVDFGGNLFGQWPAGIRFSIGVEQIFRASELFDFVFVRAQDCILVSQDWISDGNLESPYTSLFKTPGVFRMEPGEFQSLEVSPFDETPYRLTWTCLSPLEIDAGRLFQAVANREQEGLPKISSGVYVIDPSAKIIMNMYDDRGLDVIAAKLELLRPLFERFSAWILDDQRQSVEFRFKPSSLTLSE